MELTGIRGGREHTSLRDVGKNPKEETSKALPRRSALLLGRDHHCCVLPLVASEYFCILSGLKKTPHTFVEF